MLVVNIYLFGYNITDKSMTSSIVLNQKFIDLKKKVLSVIQNGKILKSQWPRKGEILNLSSTGQNKMFCLGNTKWENISCSGVFLLRRKFLL